MSSSEEPTSEKESHSEDPDLKMLNAKRILELRKRIGARKSSEENRPAPPPISDRDLILKALVDRGDEVLLAAEASYPNEMKSLIPALAQLIKQRKVTIISGGDLLQFFRSIGMRVSVSTSISVQQHGKFVSLAEKLKNND